MEALKFLQSEMALHFFECPLVVMRHNLDILGISEMRWTYRGHFNSGNCTVYFSGSEQRRIGVAYIINKKLSKYILGYNPVNDRSKRTVLF